MKKTITETKTRTVEVCDLCERDCGNGFSNSCYICRHQCCLTCSRLVQCYSDFDRRLLDLSFKICCQCETIGDKLHLTERITAIADGADNKIRELLDQWQSLAGK